MKQFSIIGIFLFLLLANCSGPSKLLDQSLGRNRNVCKSLKGNVLAYLIFVDTKAGEPWNDAEIKSTIEHFIEAFSWLEDEAAKNNIPLKIRIETPGEHKTVKKDFPIKNVSAMKSFDMRDLKKLNDWANSVAKKVAVNMIGKNGNDSLPTVVSPKDRERLIARLRNEYNTESVALFFVTNHSEPNQVAMPLNNMSNTEIEYAINSYRKPGVIAYEMLTMFGADGLFYSKKGRSRKDSRFALDEFPYDIMSDPFADLSGANIGAFSRYLIGWTNELDKRYNRLLKY